MRGAVNACWRSAALAFALGLVAAACGGSGHRPRRAAPAGAAAGVQGEATSGRVALSLALATVPGSPAATRETFALSAAGPFEASSPAGAPSFALSITLSWKARGQPARTLPLALVAGAGGVSLRVNGHRLALSRGLAEALAAGYLAGRGRSAAGAAAPLGLDPGSWLAAPRAEGSTTSGAQGTVRLGGPLALAPFLAAVSRLVRLSTSLQELAGAGAEASGTASALSAAARGGHGSGTLELSNGARDGRLRSFSASAALRGPAGSREGAGRAMTISLALSFSALGTPQRIPPA